MAKKHTSLNELGIDFILKPLIDDLKILYKEGINISINQKNFRVKAVLSLIIDDNQRHNFLGLKSRKNR
jgi:hypothetical protein